MCSRGYFQTLTSAPVPRAFKDNATMKWTSLPVTVMLGGHLSAVTQVNDNNYTGVATEDYLLLVGVLGDETKPYSPHSQ